MASKASEIKHSNESDGTVGSLEKESNEENKSELQWVYDQLYKQSYKFVNTNVKLNNKLIKAQEEVDSLKKINEDAQVEINQLKSHQIILNDKVRFLEKDAFDRDGFKKALKKNLKLEDDLSKSSLTFKKYETSVSTVEKVCLNQKHSWDTRDIGYEAEPTKSK